MPIKKMNETDPDMVYFRFVNKFSLDGRRKKKTITSLFFFCKKIIRKSDEKKYIVFIYYICNIASYV